MSGHAARIRWRDGAWELRCDDCRDGRFWPIGSGPTDPITSEFWMPGRGFKRCRACHRARDARNKREKWARDVSFRERRRLAARRYRIAAKHAQHIKDAADWQAVKADPEKLAKARAQAREATRRYRQRQREAA